MLNLRERIKHCVMIILKDHTISKRGKSRIITIKKGYVDKISMHRGKGVLVYIGNESAINSRISFSKPNYYIIIQSSLTKNLEKYFGKSLDIIIKLTETVKK